MIERHDVKRVQFDPIIIMNGTPNKTLTYPIVQMCAIHNMKFRESCHRPGFFYHVLTTTPIMCRHTVNRSID